MKYVKGYQINKVGPFCAKEWFEGFTDDVVVDKDTIVVCGLPLPREQVTELVDVNVSIATLDFTKPVKNNKPTCKPEEDELLKLFDRDAFLMDSSVLLALSKAEGKRVIPDVCRKELKQQVAFQRAVLTTADNQQERKDAYQRMRQLYLTFLKEINAAPTIKSVMRQKRK
jgi:hypothetical protein